MSPTSLLPLLLFRLLVGGFVLVVLPLSILSKHPPAPVAWLSLVTLLGTCAVAVGTVLYLGCVWDFVIFGRGFSPKDLVARGMYRFVRNPMYAAIVLVLLGESVVFRSWRLLGFALVLWLGLHLLVVLYEERGLAAAFGDSYRLYRVNVPRWVPLPPLRPSDSESPSARNRLALFGIAAGLWVAAVAVKGVIRPADGPHTPEWLRLFLGSAPSFLGGLSVPLCFLAVHPRPGIRDVRRACLWALPIVLVAELLERRLSGSTFDWLDLAASVLGVAAAALLSWLLLRSVATGT